MSTAAAATVAAAAAGAATVRPAPLAPGSVSLRLYPHALDAAEVVAEIRAQARLGRAAGFDGVMTSEHHGGFAGYLPNPLQMAGWLLDAMPGGWAAACPLLLPLRPAALVIEETAWLAARFPGRVGLGVAAGSLQADFDILETTRDGLVKRFAAGLTRVADALSGRDPAELAGDPAVAACQRAPVPMVSAAMSPAAVRRAAAAGVGLLFDSLSTAARCRALTDAYREAGGRAASIMVRRIWVGPPPVRRQAQQVDVYRGYAAAPAQAHWSGDALLSSADPAELAEAVAQTVIAAGCDALNIRLHVPGVTPQEVRSQLASLGEVVPQVQRLLRERLAQP
jgi:alkanesulfonate monooxygenase SsuD/methylene tetrahydromethanopterin reductase-like flavin-dependent oxidoreductase (luciferase family)